MNPSKKGRDTVPGADHAASQPGNVPMYLMKTGNTSAEFIKTSLNSASFIHLTEKTALHMQKENALSILRVKNL